MTKCLAPGDLNQNGPCTLFTDVNTHGLNLYDCSEVTFTPALCPDDSGEGTLNVGAATVKIASVDGTVADVCVQRDANAVAAARIFQTNINNCQQIDNGTNVTPYNVNIGPINPGVTFPTLRIRGYGDIPAYGGVQADNDVGILQVLREPSKNGRAIYTNIGSPIASIGGHFFSLEALDPAATQTLMSLEGTAGTLYFPAWTYVSDVRLKENVAPIDGQTALQVVLGISPISYTMHSRNYSGFSAQNVQTVLPDAVEERSDGTMTMRDGDILANLVAAVKYLTARVEALEAAAGG